MNFHGDKLEARVGIEPTNEGFADLSLPTWVPRRWVQYSEMEALFQPHQRFSPSVVRAKVNETAGDDKLSRGENR